MDAVPGQPACPTARSAAAAYDGLVVAADVEKFRVVFDMCDAWWRLAEMPERLAASFTIQAVKKS
jgi:hypothetical protein